MRDGLLPAARWWWRAAVVLAMLCAATAVAACGDDTPTNAGGGDSGLGMLDSSVPPGEAAADTAAPEAGDSTTPADGSPDGGGDSARDGEASDAAPDTGSIYPFDAGDCGTGSLGEPVDLSCTGLYSDWPSKTVASVVQQYDPGLHLWSDGADKTRWIYLPAGKTIDTSDMDEWTFPVGTKIWKEFRLPLGDAAAETRVETRLLWKLTPTFWYRTTYRWSADGQTSATELTNGQLDAGGTGYEVPGQIQCNVCHNGRKDGVLGFEAVSLSSPGASGLDMQALTAQGLLTSPPAAPLVVPGDATQSAALAYLHANCGTACHNGGGEASFTGFFMRLDVATLGGVQSTSAYTTGWNQLAQNYTIPGAATTYRLHACDTTTSAAYYRAGHRDNVGGTPPNTQMPPIDTHVVDDVNLAAIKAWIDEGCDGGM